MSTPASNSSEGPPLPGLTRRGFIGMPEASRLPATNATSRGATKGWSLGAVDKLAASAVVMGATVAGAAVPTNIGLDVGARLLIVSCDLNETSTGARSGLNEVSDWVAKSRSVVDALVLRTGAIGQYPRTPIEHSSATQTGFVPLDLSVWGMGALNAARTHFLEMELLEVANGIWSDQAARNFLATANAVEAAVPKSDVERAIRKVELFAELPPQWAGAHTELPSAEVRANAKAFLRLLPAGLPPPHVSPSADGTIGFEWETRRDFLAVEFGPDGLIWHHRREGQLAGGEETQWNDAIPTVLLKQLKRSFG